MAIPKTYEDIAAEIDEFNQTIAAKPFHVQAEVFFVEDHGVTSETQLTNEVVFYPLIKARIVRIFRGESLQIGDEVSFRLWASNEEIYGGNTPADYRELKETRYFELLLEVEHIDRLFSYGSKELDLSCKKKIDKPTDNPVLVKLLAQKNENLSYNPTQIVSKMLCRGCGAEFQQNSKFCGRCGMKYLI